MLFRSRSEKGFVFSTVLGLVTICVVVAAVLLDDRYEIWKQAVRETDNVAILAEQDIARNIELYNLSIQAAVDGVSDPVVMAQEPAIRQSVLFDRAATARGLGSLLVLDENGSIVLDASSPVPRSGNFSDRDYFEVHKASSTDIGLYVSTPYQSRLRDGDWSIGLSRRVNHADGSFAGIVLGTMRLEYFKDLYSKIALGSGGSMVLANARGTLIVRMPFSETAIGKDISAAPVYMNFAAAKSGHYEATGLDGVSRLVSYRQLGDLPLIQIVGRPVSEIYESWWRKTIATGGALFAACGFVLILIMRLESELGRRATAEKTLSALAKIDELTRLANRRKFDEMLDFEWRRAKRDDTTFSLLMLDVDFFKPFNDNYGHIEGDKVLHILANCIQDNLHRSSDLAARYGGEEFVVLLPETECAGAMHIAQTIRDAVFDLRYPHVKSPYGIVTVSVGVACLRPQAFEDSYTLVQEADEALYAAKAGGRNRVVAALPRKPAKPSKIVRFG
jgi:diguanylate cyclase (GGDEF)-like protein